MELGEICCFLELASGQIIQCALDYGKKIGVTFAEGKALEDKWAIHWH
jgi:hypothetical protein